MKKHMDTLSTALDSKVNAINEDLDKLAQQMKEAEVREIRRLTMQFTMWYFLQLHTHTHTHTQLLLY